MIYWLHKLWTIRSKPDQKLVESYIFILTRNAITNFSKLQSIIALLTWKAKYMSIWDKKEDSLVKTFIGRVRVQKTKPDPGQSRKSGFYFVG